MRVLIEETPARPVYKPASSWTRFWRAWWWEPVRFGLAFLLAAFFWNGWARRVVWLSRLIGNGW